MHDVLQFIFFISSQCSLKAVTPSSAEPFCPSDFPEMEDTQPQYSRRYAGKLHFPMTIPGTSFLALSRLFVDIPVATKPARYADAGEAVEAENITQKPPDNPNVCFVFMNI